MNRTLLALSCLVCLACSPPTMTMTGGGSASSGGSASAGGRAAAGGEAAGGSAGGDNSGGSTSAGGQAGGSVGGSGGGTTGGGNTGGADAGGAVGGGAVGGGAVGGGGFGGGNVGGGTAAPRIVSFTAQRSTITSGQSVELTAVFENGTGSIDQSIGVVQTGTPIQTMPLLAPTTFTLTVTGANSQTVDAQVTVAVVLAPTITSFNSTLALVLSGQSSDLIPIFSNGTGVVDNNIGSVVSGVPRTTGGLTQTTTYTLTVTNNAGDSVTRTTTIQVANGPQIGSFTALKTRVTRGTGTNLTAMYVGGTGAVAGLGPLMSGGVVPTGPLTQQTTYTLTVTGTVGQPATAMVTVDVVDPPVIGSFTAARTQISEGEWTQLTAVFDGGVGTVDRAVGMVQSGVPANTFPIAPGQATYTLTVTNPAMDSVTATTTIITLPAPRITSFAATPPDVSLGSSTSLTAVFSGGIATVGGITQPLSSGAPVTPAPITAPGPTTYTLTVTNDAGSSITRTATVNGWPLPDISNFSANPTSLTVGGTAVLSGAFDGGTGTIDQSIGAVSSPFMRNTAALTATRTFTLTVRNPANTTVTRAVTVTAVPAPIITSFTARQLPSGDAGTNIVVPVGASAEFLPSFASGVGVVSPSQPVDSGVPFVRGPLTNDLTLTLSVTNPVGTVVTRRSTVFVEHDLYVGSDNGYVAVYRSRVDGSVAPTRQIWVANCTWPMGLALIPAAGATPSALWVACRARGTVFPTLDEIVKVPSPETINNTYPTRVSGSVVITGTNTRLTGANSMVASSSELFVLNQASATTPASVLVFPLNTVGGNIAPSRAIIPPSSGDLTQLGQTSQLTLYGTELFVTSNANNGQGITGVIAYPQVWSGANSNVPPSRVITSTTLTDVRGVHVDSGGIYVGGFALLQRYPVNATGATTPALSSTQSGNRQLMRYDDTLYFGLTGYVNRFDVTTFTQQGAIVSNALATPGNFVLDPVR